MANVLTDNPWVIDTAGSANLRTAWSDIRRILWVAPGSVAGDEANVQDQNSNVIFRRLATGANTSVFEEYEERFGRPVNGLKVPTLGSGILYIFFATRE